MYSSSPTRYREIVKAWILWAVQNDIPLDGPGDGSDNATSHVTRKCVDIPYSRRYFIMAHIERDHATPPNGDVATFLSPESTFDRQESALWLEDLLRDIHRKVRRTNPMRWFCN